MKTNLALLAAAILLQTSVYAQTTSTSIDPPGMGASTNTNVATDNTAAKASGVSVGIKYLGIVNGPGLQFSGARQAANKPQSQAAADDYGQMNIDNRPKVFARIGENIEAGIEPRFTTYFGTGNRGDNTKATNFQATAGSMRLFANFKHVYKDNVFDLTLIPRAFLPTAAKYRNSKTTISPDLIADFTVTPKNSRFTIDLGLEYIHLLHSGDSSDVSASDYAKATTAVFAPWLEVDYQLTTNTQLMIAYWPELVASARNNTPMHTDSNEVDIGAYYQFAKGWQVNPYIMAQPLGMDVGSPLANLQLNLLFVGTVL